jgi:hypothetical protein
MPQTPRKRLSRSIQSEDQLASNSQNSDVDLAFELAMLDKEQEIARKRLEIIDKRYIVVSKLSAAP